MARFEIKLTEEARAAAEPLAAEGKGLRFAVMRSGCCSIAVSIYPDAERFGDQVIDVEGIHVLTRNEYPELQWNGTIDYKAKGLHKGFSWK